MWGSSGGSSFGVARAHPHDLDRVALAGVGDGLERVQQDVPVREAEVADQQVGAPFGCPALGQPVQLPVERLAGAGALRVERVAECLLEAGELVGVRGGVLPGRLPFRDRSVDRRLCEDREHVTRDVGEQPSAVHRVEQGVACVVQGLLALVELRARRVARLARVARTTR